MSKKIDLKLPPLIAIAGDEGAGKTTTAQCLRIAYGYEIRSFAAPIKTYLASLGVPRPALYGTPDEKAAPLPRYDGRSGREMMERQADAAKDLLGERVFAMATFGGIYRSQSQLHVIDDLRFPAELYVVKENFGVVWRVVREDAGVTWPDTDRVIVNDGDVPRLFDRVREALGQ